MMTEENIHNLVRRLIELGEDERELRFWEEIFGDLKEGQQKELIDSFEEEIGKLSAIAKK
jgi:hypothetical protein